MIYSSNIMKVSYFQGNTTEIHYLSSYSPDLNPYEYLNCDLQTELAKRPERRIKGNFTKAVRSTMKGFKVFQKGSPVTSKRSHWTT